MPRRTGLGRGLEALIPGGEMPSQGGVSSIAVEQIVPNPRQPRSRFDADELAELAESIREHGVIQPLIVSFDEQTGMYVLIAGERRLMASRQAGLDHVPAMIREANDQQRLELALIENVQRADLGPLERAEAYRQLAEDFNLTQEDIASRVGKSRETVANTLRLLKLSAAGKQSLVANQISEGHARALLALNSPPAQNAALQTVLRYDLNVRQTEDLVRKLSGERPPSRPVVEETPEIKALEERLQERFGTRVNMNHRKSGGGTLTIHYYSDEELNRLIGQLFGES
jgi:ParB family transcriptional regulator, chromosome partitioning protein